MASPCEVLVESTDPAVVRYLGELASREAWRIEGRYSRYRPDSLLSQLNAGTGEPRELDPETAGLMDFSRQCFVDSEGAFDITSGVLRQAWKFDGSTNIPSQALIDSLLPRVGFDKLRWAAPRLQLPVGMELDFGGIGKEYAVDRALALCVAQFPGAVLVNFGGDLACRGAPVGGAWQVGVERPLEHRTAGLLLALGGQGGVATSGDTHRYVLHQGRRLGHVLDPRTGWPVEGGPSSVTVAASTCIEAGTLATLALLQGVGAVNFLEEQGARYWFQ